ncbi:MAG: [LysW]-aminoadipate/[LysW]-glutamate kinase [Desulfurococcaceae archaeon]
MVLSIVVKAGGRAIAMNLDNIVSDIVNISSTWKTVFVHGGGDMVTEMCRRLGIEPRFVTSPEGIRSRYTDRDELDVYLMVMAGKLNKMIVSKIIALGKKVIGLSGADGPLLIAERKKKIVVVDERGRKRVIDGGYTGKVVEVKLDLLEKLLGEYIVVVSPIAIDREGLLLNIDGDQAAYAIASSIKANTLVLLSDVEGVLLGDKLIKELRARDIDLIIDKIGPGMNRKLLLAKKAVEEGVNQVVISSGLVANPVSNALKGMGTLITRG